MRRLRLIAAVAIIVILLTGCWDRREINDLAIIQATGIDWEKDRYKVTVQFPLVGQLGGSKGGGGGTSGSTSWYVKSGSGNTILQAVNLIQKSLPRRIYSAHRRVLVLGEGMAEEGVTYIVDLLARLPENRITSLIFISKGPANRLINTPSQVEKIPAEAIRELGIESFRHPVMLKNFINAMLADGLDPYAPVIDLVKANKGKPHPSIRISGLALFKHNKLAGIMNDQEAMGVLWALNQLRRPYLTVKSPNGEGKLTIQFENTHLELVPQIRGKKIRMLMRIKGTYGVVENESDYALFDYKKTSQLTKAIEKEIAKKINQSIKALQTEYHSDPIGFGDAIRRANPALWASIKDKWETVYPSITLDYRFRIHLENTGTIAKPMGVPNKELEQ